MPSYTKIHVGFNCASDSKLESHIKLASIGKLPMQVTPVLLLYPGGQPQVTVEKL